MAQAARLNLRMQKEIKILLNDPPHGVSLNLSEDENTLSSLSSIEARIEGPEETVYAKGVFSLKIQIPERYPFQPPNVTFVTPIYHPNIDNGGRICLDILNLPPKGAWQPSLNIATVLTSIGLLLSEPNPDDGLMAEISREYKYNRQVFDTNARSWTQKYANPAAVGASGWGSVDAAILKTQAEDTENLGALPKVSSKDNEGSQRKMRLLGRKLSLKSDGSEENAKTDQQSLVPGHLPSIPRSANPTACMSDISGKRNASPEKMSACAAGGVVLEKGCQGNRTNLQLIGQKLPVASESPSGRSNDNDLLPNQLPRSAPDGKDHVMQSSDDVLEDGFMRSIGVSLGSSYKPSEGNKRNIRTLGLKMSLKAVKSEKNSDGQKENMIPNNLPSQSSINDLQKRPEKNSDDQKENMVPNRLPSQPSCNNMQKRPLDVVSRKQSSRGTTLVEQNSNTEHQLPNTQSISNDDCNQGRKKLCLLNRRLSLKSELPGVLSTCEKGYKPPDCSESDKKPNELPLSAPVLETQTVAPNELPLSAPVLKSQTLGFASSQKDANPSNSSIKQNAIATENIVVSDSEDSADEREKPPRSRLSLMRRRLAGKQS
ncbi:hypothetical protein ACP70R_037811 [Stipagrostis hirtigluma subsp. patula]